ncbi:MAG: helix-turn-helix transcriptional regulator [Bacteroidota bacterium]
MEDVFSFKPSTKKNPFKPHRINFFALLLLTEGEMSHEVDFVEYKMTKGDCLFISKGQIHKFDKSPTYKGHGTIFTEEFMLHHFSLSAFSKISFLFNYHLNPCLFSDFGDRDILINALKRETSLDLGNIKADVIGSILTVFLLKAQLYTSHALNSDKEDYENFSKFQKLVASKYSRTRAAKNYAEFLNITYKRLNKLSEAFTKNTAKEYINDHIILEAKRRLVTTNFPIKEIAYECGFNETTNFLKFFKKRTGNTPKEFRAFRA